MAEKKIICDTDVMIDYWDVHQFRHTATKNTLEKKIGLDQVVLSAITKMELFSGASNKKELHLIDQKLGRFNIALINSEITIKSFDLHKIYRLSHGLLFPDSIIASTAIVSGLALFTYNTKDYKFISGLQLFKG